MSQMIAAQRAAKAVRPSAAPGFRAAGNTIWVPRGPVLTRIGEAAGWRYGRLSGAGPKSFSSSRLIGSALAAVRNTGTSNVAV
jgi:hypothetical protein